MSGYVYIGTNERSYDSWRDNFYRGLPRKNWLRFSTGRLTGIDAVTVTMGMPGYAGLPLPMPLLAAQGS